MVHGFIALYAEFSSSILLIRTSVELLSYLIHL